MAHYESNTMTAMAAIDAKIESELRGFGEDFEAALQEEFRGSKSGVLIGRYKNLRRYAAQVISGRGYKAGNTPSRRGIKQRSGPGEAPAIQTAALSRGVRAVVTRTGSTWSLIVGVTKQSGRGSPQGKTSRSIAEDLEFGTSKMQPRPAWRPALAKCVKKWSSRLATR
jgi:hypothetical protein